jgi:hypothetical protein
MTVRIVGAGLGRTGTTSLDQALERLLGGPCYHFREVLHRPGDDAVWLDLLEHGQQPDWVQWLDGFRATLDWPACAYWADIAAAFPDALVLLSTRESADAWYASYAKTIVPILVDEKKFHRRAHDVARRVTFDTFTADVTSPDAVKRAYHEHNAKVRASVDPARLVEWHPGDGWEPLCAALGLPVPAEPFPHANSADDFRVDLRLDKPGPVRRTLPQRAAGRLRRLMQSRG